MQAKKRRAEKLPEEIHPNELWLAPDIHRIITGKEPQDPVRAPARLPQVPGNRLLELADTALLKPGTSRLKRRRTDPK